LECICRFDIDQYILHSGMCLSVCLLHNMCHTVSAQSLHKKVSEFPPSVRGGKLRNFLCATTCPIEARSDLTRTNQLTLLKGL
jgi:hypothetical protein